MIPAASVAANVPALLISTSIKSWCSCQKLIVARESRRMTLPLRRNLFTPRDGAHDGIENKSGKGDGHSSHHGRTLRHEPEKPTREQGKQDRPH